MAPTQPYLYASPAYDYAFDPKVYSRSSLVLPSPIPLKPEGPLLDFNRHPDSYLNLPYGQTNAIPLEPSTKRNVTTVRRFQLTLRISQMLCVLEILVAAICIRSVQYVESWVLRATPVVDFLITAYAIYHLIRPAKERTPASSASYHFFALFMDFGLVPFYVFIAMVSKTELAVPVTSKDRWTSIFASTEATNKMLNATWLTAVVSGGLHLITLIISIYLVYIFRKISQLPPDMNPLEDNLTSRRKRKHEYKGSEIVSEQRPSDDTMINVPSLKFTGGSSPIEDVSVMEKSRPISFFHTRNESGQIYSPHTLITAHASRTSLPFDQQSPSARSYINLAHVPPRGSSLSPSKRFHSPSKQSELPSNRSPDFWSEPLLHMPPMTNSTFTSDYHDPAPPLPKKSSKRDLGFISDNWFVKNGEKIKPHFNAIDQENEPDEHTNRGFDIKNFRKRPYQQLQQSAVDEDITTHHDSRAAYDLVPPPKDDSLNVHPLGMNPPTPRISTHGGERTSIGEMVGGQALMANSGNTSPKSKYYGDLRSATLGMGGSPSNKSPKNKHDSGLGLPERFSSEYPLRYSYEKDVVEKKDWAIGAQGRDVDGIGRVVSRSGIDIGDAGMPFYFDDEEGCGDGTGEATGWRGRKISGMVAGEGLGGRWARRRSGKGI